MGWYFLERDTWHLYWFTFWKKCQYITFWIGSSCFVFTPKELHDIRSSITDALYIYQRDFEIIESSEKSKKIHTRTQRIENIEQITYDLFTFNEMAQDLRDQYYACFHQIEKTFLPRMQAYSGIQNTKKYRLTGIQNRKIYKKVPGNSK